MNILSQWPRFEPSIPNTSLERYRCTIQIGKPILLYIISTISHAFYLRKVVVVVMIVMVVFMLEI
jgi:hypothetical protein